VRTIEDTGAERVARSGRFLRDVRVAWRIATVVYAYIVPGRIVRARYRRAAERGETFYVDEELPR
jgi:hypothetical protein